MMNVALFLALAPALHQSPASTVPTPTFTPSWTATATRPLVGLDEIQPFGRPAATTIGSLPIPSGTTGFVPTVQVSSTGGGNQVGVGRNQNGFDQGEDDPRRLRAIFDLEVEFEAELYRLESLSTSRAVEVVDLGNFEAMAVAWARMVNEELPDACSLQVRLAGAIERARVRAQALEFSAASVRELQQDMIEIRIRRIMAYARARLGTNRSTADGFVTQFEAMLVRRAELMSDDVDDAARIRAALAGHVAELELAFNRAGVERLRNLRAQILREELAIVLNRVRQMAQAPDAGSPSTYRTMAGLLIEQARVLAGQSDCN